MTRTKGTSRIKKTGAHANSQADLNENTRPGNPTNATDAATHTDALISQDQAAQVVKEKRHRNRPDLANFGQEYVQPGDNARYIREARVSFDGGLTRQPLPPIDISDPEQVKQRISEYLDFCEEHDKKPSPVALAAWVGVSRETLNLWKRGEYRSETHFDVIKKAMVLMEEIWYDMMQNGKINPASGIFLAKNMFGYKDIADVVVTPNNPLQDMDAQQAAKRITDAIPADDGDVE